MFEAHLARPFKRAVDWSRNRVNDLSVRMAAPAFLDQYPGRAVPYYFAMKYDLGLLATRRNGIVGFDGLAPVVDLGDFLVPEKNMFVNREGAFHWTSSNITGYASLTYDANPGFATVINPRPVGDIFDRAIENNGGALVQNYFFSHVDYQTRAMTCFDVQIYDRKRSKRLHEGWLPMQTLCGQDFANKRSARPARFDPNSEIEIRVRLLEERMGDLLDTTQAFDAAQFRGYLYIVIGGYKVLEV